MSERCFVGNKGCLDVTIDGFACANCAPSVRHDDRMRNALALLDDMQAEGWDTSGIIAYLNHLEETQ